MTLTSPSQFTGYVLGGNVLDGLKLLTFESADTLSRTLSVGIIIEMSGDHVHGSSRIASRFPILFAL